MALTVDRIDSGMFSSESESESAKPLFAIDSRMHRSLRMQLSHLVRYRKNQAAAAAIATRPTIPPRATIGVFTAAAPDIVAVDDALAEDGCTAAAKTPPWTWAGEEALPALAAAEA